MLARAGPALPLLLSPPVPRPCRQLPYHRDVCLRVLEELEAGGGELVVMVRCA